jgi:hypothetical protein
VDFENALSEIKTFWSKPDFPIPGRAGSVHRLRLEKEYGHPLPDWLAHYIEEIASLEDFQLETVGNPLDIYGAKRLSTRHDGYNWNPIDQETIPDWDANWFIIADESADPVIVDINTSEPTVLKALHGEGEWDFDPVAESIGQFLLCSAAIHHALTHWGQLEAVTIDEDGDCLLAAEPAEWLFPRLKRWAGEYYEIWALDFDNSP